MTERIFVSIASYRDTECQWTVRDLFGKASQPDRVFVGICWQFTAGEDDDCFQISTRPGQCRVIEVDARDSRGVCWARSKVQGLWQGEEYCLQIDAHSRFAPGWDEALIRMLQACPSARPVLSTYPASYTPPDALGDAVVPRLYAKEFSDERILVPGSHWVGPGEVPPDPQPAAFVAGGFIFSAAQALREVPYDPHIYFIGEEITLAARLWTHGWDIFTPTQAVVWHEYSDRPNKRRHWHDHAQWTALNELSAARVRHLLGTQVCTDPQALAELDRYGLGSARPLSAYEALAGVDFAGCRVGGLTRDEVEADLALRDPQKGMRACFSQLWQTNAWGCEETRSGPGSTLAQTEALRRKLPDLFLDLGVRTLVDAGCGDLHWMALISQDLRLYLGFDVVPGIVEAVRERHVARKNHLFNTADVTVDTLPASDAIFCRDVLTHLNHAQVRRALGCFARSGSRYLIATTFESGSNDWIRMGGWQPMDLCAAPFSLPQPMLRVSEELPGSSKALGVWPMSDLKSFA